MAEINIGGELVPKTIAKKVAKAEYVYDPNKGGKKQSEINEELYQSKDVLPFDSVVASEIHAIAPVTQNEPDEIIYSSFNKRFIAVVGSGGLQMHYYAWPGYEKYVDTSNNNAPYDSKVYLCGGKTYVWNGTDLVAGGGEQIQSDWSQTNTEAKDYIKNKPTIPDPSTIATKQELSEGLADKADKSEMSVTPGTDADADKTTIQLKSGTSATVLTQHQDISGKANTSDVNTALALKANASDLQELDTQVNDRLNEQDDKIELLDGHEVIVVADHTAVQNPDTQKIYREYGTNSFTDWMCTDNTTTPATWQDIATYSMPGIDNTPAAGSENLVKSGGVYKALCEKINSPEDGMKVTDNGAIVKDSNCITTEYLDTTGYQSIRWEYHTMSVSTLPKLGFYYENMAPKGAYGQVSGNARTVSVPEDTPYVRASFDWSTYGYNDWKVIGIDSNSNETVLWDTSHLIEKKLNETVLFTPQSLTAAQKQQARKNIGAASDAVSFVNLHQVAPYDGSSANEYPNITTARTMVPADMQKPGIVIAYKCYGLWRIEQMIGVNYSTSDASWETLSKSNVYNIEDLHRQITGEIVGMYIGATGNGNEKFTAKTGYFITPVIPVGDATSIVWNYVSYAADVVKFELLDENLDKISLFNQLPNAPSRTIDISSYPTIKYIRATFEEVNRKDCTLTDNNGNVLWSSSSQEGGSGTSDILGEGKMVYGDTSVELKVYSNSQRLNPDGTLVGYSGFVTSRAFIVNKGDIIHYRGTYDNGSMAFAVGYSDRLATTDNKTESFTATSKDGTQDIFFKITDSATKYVRVCSHTAVGSGQTVDPSLFAVDIIPADGFISDVAENLIGNYFPNALDKAKPFVQKLLNGDDVQICLLGDSVTQIANQSANEHPESLPPFMERKNWCYWLWRGINKTKDMICRRNDYDGFFTKVGTFTVPSDTDNSFNNAYSTDGNASFAFEWNLGTYEKTNLVMPISGNQSNDIKIDVIVDGNASNDKVEYYDYGSKQWVEANGVSMSFLRLSGSAGKLLNCNNNRYKLRRKSGITGTVTIKVYKNTSDSDRLQFWGVEQWNGQGIFISNAAYGGYGTYELQPGNISNVKYRYPDLVLFELTLVNNFGDRLNESNSKELMINDFYDYIWGDRSGNANSLALKAISNNWQDWQMLGVIPHYRKQWMDGDDFRTYVGGRTIAYTANECYNAVKALFMTKDDVNFVDMGAALKWEAHRRGWTVEQSYDGDEHSDMKSFKTFTQDTVHLNDSGSKIYGNYLAPIFDIA